MIPNHQETLDTPEQRREAARPFIAELGKLIPAPVTLFGIEQHTLDLLDFRQDILERIADLEALAQDAAEPIAIAELINDARAELAACNMELARLAGEEVSKVDNIANLLRMCDRMIAHRKDERDRQNRAAKRWESIKEGVEQVVMEALTLANRTRFDSPTNTLRMQRNGTPKVEIVDPQAVQDRFITVTLQTTADRYKQIREALPELVQFVTEKERTFAVGAIAKVLKASVNADVAIETLAEAEKWPSKQLAEAKKQVDRVRGAKLSYGKHLRCE